MRLVRLQGIVCSLGPRTIGLPWRRLGAVSNPPGDSSRNRPPGLAPQVHSLMSRLLYGVPSRSSPAEPFGAATPAGVSSLFATSPMESTFAGVLRRTALFRPQAFATSRRFAPPSASRACFIPLPRPGFSPFRGFSRSASSLSRRKRLAPVLLAPSRSPAETGCHARAPQLRGFSPRIEAFLRVGV